MIGGDIGKGIAGNRPHRYPVHFNVGNLVVCSGAMVKVWFAPEFTVTAPVGEIDPFAPGREVNVLGTKLAEMV